MAKDLSRKARGISNLRHRLTQINPAVNANRLPLLQKICRLLLQAQVYSREESSRRNPLTTSIAHSGSDEMPTTKSQSKYHNGSVLNILCRNGMYTTIICTKNDVAVARISFLLVSIPILNRDSVILRQLKA